jgi:Kef-type K+ transport system membrane component KefB
MFSQFFTTFMESPLNVFLVQTVLVIVTTRTLAFGFRKIGQPDVIAEIIGGILLGPSALGKFFSPTIFPLSSLDTLNVIGNWGLIIYLFLTGVEMDFNQCVNDFKKNIAIAVTGIVFPFVTGACISPLLYKEMTDSAPDYVLFTLFVCLSMSITAFAVLCRLLSEFSLMKTSIGMSVLGAASIDDVIAWCLLAGLMSMMKSNANMLDALIVLCIATCYASFVLMIVRPRWHRLIDHLYYSRSKSLQFTLLTLNFLFIFTSSLITDAIGIHAIFGGYLVGLIMPNGHPFTLQISSKVQDLVSIILLPLYFTLSGLKTNFNGLHSWKDFGLFLMILCSAIIGKLGGCGLTSLCLGMTKKESLIVGILMNTRGLVEIIILNIGLQANIISDKLFTLFVSMAICTTLLTSPCINILYPTIEKTHVADDISYYDLKTGSIEHTPSINVLREVSDIGIVMVVNSSGDVPALASLIHILKPQDGKEFVMVCSLTDSCMTTTDIIQATTSIQKLSIPLQMLQGIAMTINNVEMAFFNISCNSKHFANNLIRKSLESDIDITILPYSRGPTHNGYNHFIHKMLAFKGNTIVILLSGIITHEIICEKDTTDVLIIITGHSNDMGMLNFIDKWKRWISPSGLINISFHFLILTPIEKLSKTILDKLEEYGIDLEFGDDYNSILHLLSKDDYHYHFIITGFSSINNDSLILGDVGSYLFSKNISPSILIIHNDSILQQEEEEENGFVQITV